MDKTIRILGAGPSGLTAAIQLARAGRRVVVYERRPQVGGRFNGDFQGLENWTRSADVLEDLERWGVSRNFELTPIRRGVIYSPRLEAKEVTSDRPLVYLVKRGPQPGSLDRGLRAQAESLGVDIHFRSTAPPESVDILATGPKGMNALAMGITFRTRLQDGAYAVVSDRLAPRGYAYLLVADGEATLASVLFGRFDRAQVYLAETVQTFERLIGEKIEARKPWAGYGSFRIPTSAQQDGALVVGEAAGFQDFLFGFGIRTAMDSGSLAARSLLEGGSYDRLWRQQLGPVLRTTALNRAIYGKLGRIAYYVLWWTLGSARRPERVMHWLYRWAGSLPRRTAGAA